MKLQLIVTAFAYREEFFMGDFIGTDDIFFLVKSGSFTVGSEGEEFTVAAGEGMLFKKDKLYHRAVNEPVAAFLFRYRSDEALFDEELVKFKDSERIRSTLALLEALEGSLSSAAHEYRRHLLMDLSLQYRLENQEKRSLDGPVESALAVINGSLHKKLDIAELAKKSGLSYVQFLRRFKGLVGKTPTDYVIELRLQRAKQQLSETELCVKDIAFSCGFENEYYFSNFFKKHTGLSPTAYRRLSH